MRLRQPRTDRRTYPPSQCHHQRLERPLQPPTPAPRARLPTASGLRCWPHPPMNGSHTRWISSRGQATSPRPYRTTSTGPVTSWASSTTGPVAGTASAALATGRECEARLTGEESGRLPHGHVPGNGSMDSRRCAPGEAPATWTSQCVLSALPPLAAAQRSRRSPRSSRSRATSVPSRSACSDRPRGPAGLCRSAAELFGRVGCYDLPQIP